jgi:transcriptional regulator with PAS, ATPase and Fis domain
MAIERTQKYLQINRKLKQMEERNSLISKKLEASIDRQFIGVSKQIQEILEQAITAAGYPDANVLITGESGTGKENIARIIHYSSERKDNLFGAVNSSAITESLLESEFFGHKKGSFTGALSDKMGFFEVCHKGTLFLDEIADMPMNLQSKILRAIEEKIITRVGTTRTIQTDFRVISATNHNIENLIEQHKFRLDLLHRLNTLHIHIPALRERPDDIEPLLMHFVNYYSQKFKKTNISVSKGVTEVLRKYSFPGNVRELKNMTERAIILCKGNTLSVSDFPVNGKKTDQSIPDDEVLDLKSQEIKLIRKVLQSNHYNQKIAAEALGITRDALIRKMKKYRIVINKSDNI